MLSNMTDVEWLDKTLQVRAKRKSACDLFHCIEWAWKSSSDHVRSLVHARVRIGRDIRDTEDPNWESYSVLIMGPTFGPNL